jgi:exodeoxyribonuclease VII large subunit
VGALGLRLAARKPDLAQRRARLDALAQRLERAGQNLLERRRSRLDALAQHLAHLDPRGVLARGYSITRNAAGEIVRDARTLAPATASGSSFTRAAWTPREPQND